MRSESSNTFNEGINLDINPYQLPNNTMSDCVNCELITQEGNEFILQNDKGNTLKGEIKEGYVPVASKTYKGVAYIISAEVVENILTGEKEFTGRGEVGSFPSPDFSTSTLVNSQTLSGSMTNDYRPFKNYLKEIYDPEDPLVLGESFSDYGTASSVYGDFNTTRFNFTEKTNYDIEVQPSYDGSVNVIFTDNINPPRIINSRFSPLKSNKFNVIDRTGQKDVNLYHKELFDTTINLIQTSNKLINVDLDNIPETGVLPCGTYRYYFAYETQDGNFTDVLAETFQIPIFRGNSLLSIDAPSDFDSGKSVVLSLKNLDTSFSQLRVYYTHHYGENEEISQTYLLSSTIPISNSTISFTHTGREESVPIDSSVISTSFSTIDTVRTIAQTQSRLFLGNVTLKGFDVEELSAFAEQIKPRYVKRTIEKSPLTKSNSIINKNPSFRADNFTYEGGYYNPFNVYYNGSYWGGETYMFGVVFILESGALTPVFPIRGIDDWTGFYGSSFVPGGYGTATLNENNNYFDSTGVGENTRGTYRFPTRDVEDRKLIIKDGIIPTVNIFGVQLDIPTNYPEGTIGCMFVRAPRIPDASVQGVLMNTCAVPIVDTTPVDYSGNKYWNYEWREDSIKYVPAYNYIVEGSKLADRNGDDRSTKGVNGLVPFQLTTRNGTKGWEPQVPSTFEKRYALISPLLYQESEASTINGSGYVSHELATVTHRTSVPTNTWWEVEPSNNQEGHWFSLLETVDSISVSSSKDISIEYVSAESDATTINNFSSGYSFTAERNTNDEKSYGFFRNYFNGYHGVSTEDKVNNIEILETAGFNSSGGSDLAPKQTPTVKIGQDLNASVLVNIYKDLGFSRGTNDQDLERLKSSNIFTSQQFSPISKRMYWDATYRPNNEGVILQDFNNENANILRPNNIELWGGDCFPAETFRRLFYNRDIKNPGTLGEPGNVNTGYSISLIAESTLIPSMRSTFIFNVLDEAVRRSFLPLLLETNNTPLENRFNLTHQWREYRAIESNQINEGGQWLKEDRLLSPINPNLPFLKQKFPTRVFYSDTDVYDSFLNGYRNVFPQARQDYNQEMGEIIALREINNVLVCVQERGISILQVNERTAITDTSSGAVFLEGANVLSPYAQVISSNYGSTLQDTVVKSENSLYGMDDQGKFWRIAGAGQLQFISDNVIQSALKQFVPIISSREVNQLSNNIKTHYDQHKKTVYITSYTKEEQETDLSSLYTFVYSEILGKWGTRYSYYPIHSFNIRDKHYTFNLLKDSHTIWEHHSNSIRCNYYDDQYEFEVEFCINANPTIQKIFTNFVIASNEVPPKYIMYDTDNETPLDDVRPVFIADKPMVQQDVLPRFRGRYRQGDIRTSYLSHNCDWKENHHYIQIDKNTNDTRDNQSPLKPELFDNNRDIRDKFVRVKFRYEGNEYSIIQAILTKYIISFS